MIIVAAVAVVAYWTPSQVSQTDADTLAACSLLAAIITIVATLYGYTRAHLLYPPYGLKEFKRFVVTRGLAYAVLSPLVVYLGLIGFIAPTLISTGDDGAVMGISIGLATALPFAILAHWLTAPAWPLRDFIVLAVSYGILLAGVLALPLSIRSWGLGLLILILFLVYFGRVRMATGRW